MMNASRCTSTAGRERPIRSWSRPVRSRRRISQLTENLSREVFQAHAVAYRRPSDLPQGRVLVVGGGNTGFQIARVSGTRKVVLSVGSQQKPLPSGLQAVTSLVADEDKLLSTTVESRLGSRLRHRETLIGSSPRGLRRRYGVEPPTPRR